jgi:tRNA-specific 2-thiouridylase
MTSALLTATPNQPEATRPARVLCAMSGGVDSSLAASLLKEQGFEVTGAMLRFWSDDGPKGAFAVCCSPDAAYDARRVAHALDVPFYLFDARERFEKIVIEPFVPSYEQGKTPNPCVWCNREIKFGAFWRKAQMLGCDYLATGHYVRRVDTKGGVELHRGDDASKDQSYFLWALPAELLPKLLFPLGELSKEEVRKEAEARGLVTAYKPSSHGLCFITSTVKDYLREFSARKPGPVLDASQGYEQVGEHDGVQFYTIGQKKGLGLYKSHLERFVIELKPEENAVVVGTREMCHWWGLKAERANFLLEPAELPERVTIQTRYRQHPVPATLKLLGTDRFEVRFDEPMFAVTEGQSAVLYHGSRLLGGGVIVERLEPVAASA